MWSPMDKLDEVLVQLYNREINVIEARKRVLNSPVVKITQMSTDTGTGDRIKLRVLQRKFKRFYWGAVLSVSGLCCVLLYLLIN